MLISVSLCAVYDPSINPFNNMEPKSPRKFKKKIICARPDTIYRRRIKRAPFWTLETVYKRTLKMIFLLHFCATHIQGESFTLSG